MKTVEQLLASSCRDVTGPALAPTDIAAQLSVLDQWALRSGAIARTYRFKDFHATIDFINALAVMIHREDHHPDLHVGYNQCEVRYSTHSVSGISDNDFISAAKADVIYANAPFCGTGGA